MDPRSTHFFVRLIALLGIWAMISAGTAAVASPPRDFEPDAGVVASFDELQGYVESLTGDVLSRGGARSLLSRLDAAEAAYHKGKPCTGSNIIGAYLNHTSSRAFDEAVGADLHSRGLLLRNTLLGSLPESTCGAYEPLPTCFTDAPWPQLVVTEVLSQPAQSYANEGTEIVVTVENRGGVTAENIPVAFNEGTTALAPATIAAIPPCDTATATGSWPGGALGAYTVDVVADPDGTIVEGTKLDNTGAVTIPVVFEWIRPWEKTELVAAALSITPERPMADEPVSLELTVENRGPQDIPDVDVVFTVDGAENLTATIPILETQSSATAGVVWSGDPGRHHISAAVVLPIDRYDRNEGNNTQLGLVHVGGAAEPLPDLVVESFEVTVNSPPRASVAIANIGWAAATDVSIEFRFDGFIAQAVTIESIDPGETVMIDEILDADVYHEHIVSVIIDPDRIIEKYEAPTIWSTRVTAVDPDVLCAGPAWTALGPSVLDNGSTGRVDRLAIHPTHPTTMYAGAPTGGLWKTTSGGNAWAPLADTMPSLNISALVMDPTNPDILYAGSGGGIYKTVDAGDNWHVFIGTQLAIWYRTLIVTPNTDGSFELYAATDKGVWHYHGTDPTALASTMSEWTQVKTGEVRELVQHPTNPDEFFVTTVVDDVGHVYHSKPGAAPTGDGSWDEITANIPETSVITVRLTIAPADSDVMYAGVHVPTGDNGQYVLYRSDNGGDDWTERLRRDRGYQLHDNTYWENWYNDYVVADRLDEDIVYLGHVQGYRYNDTTKIPTRMLGIHDDQHGLYFHPQTETTVYMLGDGGIFECPNRGPQCSSLNETLNVVQFYDIALSASDPDLIIGGTQDNGTIRTNNGAIVWDSLRDGDGRYTLIDPVDPDIMYSQHQYLDEIRQTDAGTGPVPPLLNWHGQKGLQPGPGDTSVPKEQRWDGDPYMIHHPTDRNIIMTAGPEVYVTDAAAGDWESCKTNDSCQFTAIGPSPSSTLGDVSRVAVDPDTGMYFAATTGGQLWMSNSQGTYWTIVFTPKYGVKVDSLIIDPHDSTRLWMTFEGSGPLMTAHRVVLIERFTSDCGAGEPWCPITYWKKSPISEGIPIELSIGAGWRASNLIEVDPEYENTIYVGTQRGMYKGVGSLDEDGVWDFTWTPMNCNLPWVHVSDVELNPTTNRLYAATWGRGLWSTSIEPPDDVIE